MNRPSCAPWRALTLYCLFAGAVLGTAFYASDYPVLVISGESSVGTWLSGALLVSSSTLSFVLGLRRGAGTWGLFTVFLALLAIDERFLFHEHLQQRIRFATFESPAGDWLPLAPVLLAAAAGLVATTALWRELRPGGRRLLLAATLLGSASVAIDLVEAGPFWEDCCKLLAETSLACALIGEIEA